MMTRLTMVAAAAFLVGSTARAQTPPPPTTPQLATERYIDVKGGLSLADAVSRALEREPSLRAARTEIDVARAMRTQAGLRPNPTASLERREEPGGSDNQTMVSVEWPLNVFRRPARLKVGDRDVEAVEHSVADRARLLEADVRTRYGEAAAAVRELAVADSVTTSSRRQFELLRARVEAGASPPLDRDLLDVEVRRLESDRLLAIGRVDAALYELKRLLGLPVTDRLTLRDALEALVARDGGTAATVPPVEAAAVGDRPDIREAEARVRLAEARIDRARLEGRFDVSLFGSYTRMDAGFSQRGFNANGDLEPVSGVFHYLAGGAKITLPLGNKNQGEVAAAQAERAGAAARLEAAQLTAQTEVAVANSRDTQARQALALYENGVRDLAQRNLDVMRQTYELGRATVFDVLAEQRRFLDVERAYTDTLRHAYEARAALRRAGGGLQ